MICVDNWNFIIPTDKEQNIKQFNESLPHSRSHITRKHIYPEQKSPTTRRTHKQNDFHFSPEHFPKALKHATTEAVCIQIPLLPALHTKNRTPLITARRFYRRLLSLVLSLSLSLFSFFFFLFSLCAHIHVYYVCVHTRPRAMSILAPIIKKEEGRRRRVRYCETRVYPARRVWCLRAKKSYIHIYIRSRWEQRFRFPWR